MRYPQNVQNDDPNTILLYGQEADVHTERVESGTVRLRKRVVTEEIQVPVTIRREELDVIEEKAGVLPADADLHATDTHPTGAAHAGDTRAARTDVRDMGDGEVEITLYAERPVVTMEVVAVERVRVKKGVVAEVREVKVELEREEAYLEEEPTEHARDGHLGTAGRVDEGYETRPGL